MDGNITSAGTLIGTLTAEQTLSGGITRAEREIVGVLDVEVDGVSVVTDSVAEIDLTGKADVSSLATVATTGDYDDLTNKPVKAFIAEYGVTTYAEVLAAYNAGNVVFVKDGNRLASVALNYSSGMARFYAYYDVGLETIGSYQISSEGWSRVPTYLVPTYRTVNGKALSSNITLTASDVGALPSDTSIPSNLSDLTNDMDVSDFPNDAGYLTSYTETDPTVPSWAKATTKPSYTFSEIGTTPTSISGYGITDAYTKTEVDGLVSGVLHYKGTKATTSALPSSGNVTGDVWHVTADGSEWAWDGTQWQELGTAVDLSSYVQTSRKVNDKSLSSDITLTASDVGAQATLVSGTNIKTINNESILGSGNITIQGGGDVTDVEVNGTSVVTGGVAEIPAATYHKYGVVKASELTVTGSSGEVYDYGSIVHKDSFGVEEELELALTKKATRTSRGLMSSEDKTKLDGIASGAEVNVQSDWSESDTTSDAYIANKPTIPTVNNATLTIQKNGTTVNTFTANASSNVTANITVPTKVSDLTNDSGYITGYTETDPIFTASAAYGISSSDISAWNGKSDFSGDYDDLTNKPTIPTDTDDLTNGAGFITLSDVPEEIFIAEYDDTTYAEVVAAYGAGKTILMKNANKFSLLNNVGELNGNYIFSFYNFNYYDTITTYVLNTNGWTYYTVSIPVLDANGKISASNLPTYSGGVS